MKGLNNIPIIFNLIKNLKKIININPNDINIVPNILDQFKFVLFIIYNTNLD